MVVELVVSFFPVVYYFGDVFQLGLGIFRTVFQQHSSKTFSSELDVVRSSKLVLNAILNQRSQDILAANAFNVAQYAVLIHMFARECDMQVVEFVHVIADAHIYDRHIPLVEEILANEPKPAPQFSIDPSVTDFYAFTRDSFRLDGYEYSEFSKKIPVAV